MNGKTNPPNIVLWKCPTTKYESCRCRSVGTVPSTGPVNPPSKKTFIAPNTNNIGTEKRIFPSHKVAVQEKNLMPVGTATSRVEYINGTRKNSSMPAVNMW